MASASAGVTIPWAIMASVGNEARMCGDSPLPNRTSIRRWNGMRRPSAAKAKDLGGQVLAGPIPTPIGPMATLQDPQGAVFTVFHPDEWPA